MIRPGTSRRRIARTLTTAYDSGLLSADTYVHRVDALTESLIDPLRLLGDLGLRGQARGHADRLRKSMNAAAQWVREQFSGVEERRLLLSLDWEGGERELFVGRHENCDVVLLDPTVSRRHARLFFQDGSWVLLDLGSTNGTFVNGERVARAELRPGDHLVLGSEKLKVD